MFKLVELPEITSLGVDNFREVKQHSYFRKYILINAKPHPRPLSRREGRKKRTNAPLSSGEGLGVRL
jgi:hypothetical protein